MLPYSFLIPPSTWTDGEDCSVAAFCRLHVSTQDVPAIIPPDPIERINVPEFLVHWPAVPSISDVDNTDKNVESTVVDPISPEIVTRDPLAKS